MSNVLEPSLCQKLSDFINNLTFDTGFVTIRYFDLSFEFIFWKEKKIKPRKAEQKKTLILLSLEVSKERF